MTDPCVLAYLAGVLDSDGTIGIKKKNSRQWQSTYSERIHIRQVERAALELFAETFGGNLGITAPSAEHGRSLWNWGQTDRKAASTLSALLPYLRIKRAQADVCLALRTVKERSQAARVPVGRGHVGAVARSAELTSAMEGLYLRAKELNRVGA